MPSYILSKIILSVINITKVINIADMLTSTTAVWPVKIVLASTTLCSLGVALISHKQIV